MNVILVDIFCALLALAGVSLALKGARADRRRSHGPQPGPATYGTRIVGVMMAAFALALGGMVTGFSLLAG